MSKETELTKAKKATLKWQKKAQELKEDNAFLERLAKNTNNRIERLLRKVGDTQAKQIKSLQAQLTVIERIVNNE